MLKRTVYKKIAISLAASMLLVACGGSSSGGDGSSGDGGAKSGSSEYKVLKKTQDTDNDGVADKIYTYSYDAKGNNIKTSTDKNANGVADLIERYTYDTDANELTYTIDDDANGEVDKIHTYTYDTNGNKSSTSTDSDANGVANIITTYTYDTHSNISTYNYDSNADGVADSVYKYTNIYDANANKVKTTLYKPNGLVSSIYTYTYDSNGNMLTYAIDDDANGVADRIYTYTYDANDNKITSSTDRHAIGVVDSIITNTYDSNGNMLKSSTDSDANGVPDSVTTYTNGKPTISTPDTDGITDDEDEENTEDPGDGYVRGKDNNDSEVDKDDSTLSCGDWGSILGNGCYNSDNQQVGLWFRTGLNSKTTFNFIEGKLNGLYYYTENDGSESNKGNYVNGKKDGIWVEYREPHTWTYTWDNGKMIYHTNTIGSL